MLMMLTSVTATPDRTSFRCSNAGEGGSRACGVQDRGCARAAFVEGIIGIIHAVMHACHAYMWCTTIALRCACYAALRTLLGESLLGEWQSCVEVRCRTQASKNARKYIDICVVTCEHYVLTEMECRCKGFTPHF